MSGGRAGQPVGGGDALGAARRGREEDLGANPGRGQGQQPLLGEEERTFGQGFHPVFPWVSDRLAPGQA